MYSRSCLLPSVLAGVKGSGEAGRSSMEESRGFSTSSSINRPPYATAAEEGEEGVWLTTQEGEGEGMEGGTLVEGGLEGEGWIGGVARGSSTPSLCVGPERAASDSGSSPAAVASMGLGSQEEGLAPSASAVSGHGATSSVHSPLMLCVWSTPSSPVVPSFPTHSSTSSPSPPPKSSL